MRNELGAKTPKIATLADKRAVESTPLAQRDLPRSTIEALERTAARRGGHPAVSFQLNGKPKAPLFTLSYEDLLKQVRQCANGLHALGVAPGEKIALLAPNLPETVVACYAAHALGVVCPINPLLEPDIIAGILRESGAKTLVTLAPFPKTDINAKAARAARMAPQVERIVEIDMARFLPGALRLILPLLRPKRESAGAAQITPWAGMLSAAPNDRFVFERKIEPSDIGAYFHTGGTTGSPKVATHNQRGMVLNPWLIQHLIISEDDVVLCALPLFHVFANVVMMMPAITAGAHLVLASPAGFRGDKVIDNFWKLIERHRASFLCVVPTAIAALDQRPVNADVSSLRYMISGSAPLSTALFRRFEQNAQVRLIEGYGLTEATCVTSCNPPYGEAKIGSVGLPLPYIDVRIAAFDADGAFLKDCETDEVGEICFKGPFVFPGYLEEDKNKNLFFDHDAAGEGWLRTGDLGRVDADGYIWITGRAKDVIIRGGHNIDPGVIEEALSKHPAVAFVGAIGQPDPYSGEKPCAYVELKEGAQASEEELKAFAAEHVPERAARPVAVGVLEELPKTAVGKIFKPGLRCEAISRVLTEALASEGLEAKVEVEEDRKRGLVAVVRASDGALPAAKVRDALADFATPWRMEDE